MRISDIFTPEVIELIKVVGILISLVHLFAGFVLVFQTLKMNKIVKTASSAVFDLISFIYLGILLLTVILILVA